MKKLAVWMLIAVTLLSMFGCAQKEPEDERVAAALHFVHAIYVGDSQELRECVHPKLFADAMTRWNVGEWDYDEKTIEVTATGKFDELTSTEIEHERDDISDFLGEYFPIEDMCAVAVTISGRTNDGDEETDVWSVCVAQVDGTWYALYMK